MLAIIIIICVAHIVFIHTLDRITYSLFCRYLGLHLSSCGWENACPRSYRRQMPFQLGRTAVHSQLKPCPTSLYVCCARKNRKQCDSDRRKAHLYTKRDQYCFQTSKYARVIYLVGMLCVVKHDEENEIELTMREPEPLLINMASTRINKYIYKI